MQLDTRQEQAQLAAAAAQRELTRLNLERVPRPGRRGHRLAGRTTTAPRPSTSRRRRGWARSAPPSSARRSARRSRGCSGIRQVNLGQYLAGGDPVVPLQSLDPIYVNFTVPQQEVGRLQRRRRGARRGRGHGRRPFTGRITAVDSVVDEATRNVQVQATLRQPATAAAPGHVRGGAGRAGRRAATWWPCPPPRSATRPTATRSSSWSRSQGPNGQSYRGVRQQFVKLGGARGDQVAVLSGVEAGAEVVTSGVFKLRNGAAVQVNNEIQPANDPAPKPEDKLRCEAFTDLFIKRPVLAIVVNLVILIAGLQSIRSLSVRQYPRSDIAVIRVTTAYIGANADLVRGFITTPLERVIASADGIDYMESSSAQGLSTITVHLKLNYDTNAALTQIQAKVAQVRNDLPPEAEAPIIELETADNQFAADVPRLLVERARPEPDHRLPDARRAAEALRDQRRAARRHPGRPHLRHAHLAQAREDGGPRHLALAGARRAGRATTTSRRWAGPRARWCRSTWWPTPTSRTPEEFRQLVVKEEKGVGRAAGRDRRRRAGRRELRRGRPLQRRDRHLHGRLGAAHRQLARRHRAGCARRCRRSRRSCRRA